MFIEGFDQLTHEISCTNSNATKDPKEYAIIEVFEADGKGKTLDYGKAGSSKDWKPSPGYPNRKACSNGLPINQEVIEHKEGSFDPLFYLFDFIKSLQGKACREALLTVVSL